MKSKKLLFLCILMVLVALLNIAAAYPYESYGTVNNIVDGTSFDVYIEKADSRVMSNVERIKLADVESPNISTEAGSKAKDFTYAVLMNKRVFLDIDDTYGRDPSGRLSCVAYLTNSYGQPIDIPCFNRMLVDAGYARVENSTNNEFEPKNWWVGQPSGANDILQWIKDLPKQPPERIASDLPEKTRQAIDWLATNSPLGNS
ncbi:MAG: thermonuclease family protein [Methanotrichaceae archaeon]|nr:thermonuclease family protein [Methanotrichaceae archaeon]